MAPCIYFSFVTPILSIGQLFFIAVIVAQEVKSIGCFVCSSFNGSDPNCEDTFNSIVYREQSDIIGVSYYQYPCWSFKKERQGLFPADHCIKVNGHRTDDVSQTMVIRTCALDSGTLTADTEIVRISHCGHFKYDGYQYSGCVQACDTDGCNVASGIGAQLCISYMIPIIVVSIAGTFRSISLSEFLTKFIDIVNRIPIYVLALSDNSFFPWSATILLAIFIFSCVRKFLTTSAVVPEASLSWMSEILRNCLMFVSR